MTIYNRPEEYGLTLVAKVDKGDMLGYNILAVWGDPETGMLYWGDEGGCNCCDFPFEGYRKREQLVLLQDIKEFARHAREWGQSGYRAGSGVYVKLGAMMIKIRNFEEKFGIEVSNVDLDLEGLLADGD